MSNKFFAETHSRGIVTGGNIVIFFLGYNIFVVTPNKKVA